VASWNSDEPRPADTEERMARFAGLLETAIANADARNQLTTSRARLVTAGDEARRRLARDLHDGAQQRLVHTTIMLKLPPRARDAAEQRLVHTTITLMLAQRAFDDADGNGKAKALVGDALAQAERSNAEL